jgi:hypothetical protein
MVELVKKLRKLTPGIGYHKGNSYYWSPKQQSITYRQVEHEPTADWALLHEAAHALLDHQSYDSDLELLLLEVAAWQKAKELGQDLGILIDEDHIQDCLDTYRDWLHQRSTCPSCSIISMQISSREYLCHNCKTTWHVTAARFCRPYRLMKRGSQTKSRPGISSQATFQWRLTIKQPSWCVEKFDHL